MRRQPKGRPTSASTPVLLLGPRGQRLGTGRHRMRARLQLSDLHWSGGSSGLDEGSTLPDDDLLTQLKSRGNSPVSIACLRDVIHHLGSQCVEVPELLVQGHGLLQVCLVRHLHREKDPLPHLLWNGGVHHEGGEVRLLRFRPREDKTRVGRVLLATRDLDRTVQLAA